jgi:WD40 repeat protein
MYTEFKQKYTQQDSKILLEELKKVFEDNKYLNKIILFMMNLTYKCYDVQKKCGAFSYAGKINLVNVTNFNYNITKINCKDEYIPLKQRYNIAKNFIFYDFLLNCPVIELKEEKNYALLKNVPPPIMDNKPNPEVKPVNCIEKLSDSNVLACGKNNGTICFYEPFIYTLCYKLEAHDGEVLYLKHFKNKKLYSSSSDGSIKIWEVKSTYYKFYANHLHSIQNIHKGKILKVIELFNSEFFTSCSDDLYIKIFKQSSNESNYSILVGDKVKSIESSDRYLIAGSEKGNIIFYNKENIEKYDFIINDVFINNSDSILNLDNKKILVGTKDGKIIIIDIPFRNIINTIDAHVGPINCLIVNKDDGSVFSTGEDKCVNRWNIYNQHKLISFVTEHKEPVLQVLKLKAGFLATCSRDGFALIYKY